MPNVKRPEKTQFYQYIQRYSNTLFIALLVLCTVREMVNKPWIMKIKASEEGKTSKLTRMKKRSY